MHVEMVSVPREELVMLVQAARIACTTMELTGEYLRAQDAKKSPAWVARWRRQSCAADGSNLRRAITVWDAATVGDQEHKEAEA